MPGTIVEGAAHSVATGVLVKGTESLVPGPASTLQVVASFVCVALFAQGVSFQGHVKVSLAD